MHVGLWRLPVVAQCIFTGMQHLIDTVRLRQAPLSQFGSELERAIASSIVPALASGGYRLVDGFDATERLQ